MCTASNLFKHEFLTEEYTVLPKSIFYSTIAVCLFPSLCGRCTLITLKTVCMWQLDLLYALSRLNACRISYPKCLLGFSTTTEHRLLLMSGSVLYRNAHDSSWFLRMKSLCFWYFLLPYLLHFASYA